MTAPAPAATPATPTPVADEIERSIPTAPGSSEKFLEGMEVAVRIARAFECASVRRAAPAPGTATREERLARECDRARERGDEHAWTVIGLCEELSAARQATEEATARVRALEKALWRCGDEMWRARPHLPFVPDAYVKAMHEAKALGVPTSAADEDGGAK